MICTSVFYVEGSEGEACFTGDCKVLPVLSPLQDWDCSHMISSANYGRSPGLSTTFQYFPVGMSPSF